jgi:hypothetical protein
MKKFILPLIIAASTIFFDGCEFDTLPINVPISIPVAMSGSVTSVDKTENFCLTSYESYTQHLEDLEKITYIESALRVDSVSNPNLSGSLSIELKSNTGQRLFLVQLNNFKPADYKVNPYILPLTGDQIILINQYVSNNQNTCFTISVTLNNLTGAASPYFISGFIDLVFEAETKL